MSASASREDIAARLRAARARIFSSAAEAARALDMKPVTVRAHESSQNGINNYDLERYARRYGVDLVWLMTGQGSVEPSADTHMHYGEGVPLLGTVEDGSWYPTDSTAEAMHDRARVQGLPERVEYTDPRFPAEMVEAYRVRSSIHEGIYPDGSILFAVEVSLIGYRSRDHVLVLRSRGDFDEFSVRRAVQTSDGIAFEALTSDDVPFTLSDDEVHVTGVVIGSVTRRDVNLPSLEVRRRLEKEIRDDGQTPAEALADAAAPKTHRWGDESGTYVLDE